MPAYKRVAAAPSAGVDDLTDFYKGLPDGDRQFVILPGTAHSVVLGLQRRRFWPIITRS